MRQQQQRLQEINTARPNERQEGSCVGIIKSECNSVKKPCGKRSYTKVERLVDAFQQAEQYGSVMLHQMLCPKVGTSPPSTHPSRDRWYTNVGLHVSGQPICEAVESSQTESHSLGEMSVDSDNESMSAEDLEIIRMLEELQLGSVSVSDVSGIASNPATAVIDMQIDVDASVELQTGSVACPSPSGDQDEAIIQSDGTTMQIDGQEVTVDLADSDDLLGGIPALLTSTSSDGHVSMVSHEVFTLREQMQQQQERFLQREQQLQREVELRDLQFQRLQDEMRLLLQRQVQGERQMEERLQLQTEQYGQQLLRAQQEVDSMRVLSHALQGSSSLCESGSPSEMYRVPSVQNDVQNVVSVSKVQQQPLAEAAGASSSGVMQQTGVPSRPSLVPGSVKLEKPSTFSGKHNEVASFIFEMRQYVDSVNLGSDGHACRFVATFLKGQASIWWRSYSDENRLSGQSIFDTLDLDTMLNDLEEQFSDSDKEMRTREKLLNLRQKGTLQDYITLFRQYQIELGSERLSDSTALHCFQLGLASNIRQQVMVQRPKTVSEAMQYASSCNIMMPFGRDSWQPRTNREFQRRKNFQNASQYSNSRQKGHLPMVMGTMQGQQRGGSSGRGGRRGGGRVGKSSADVVCFHCNKKGHMKRDCWQLTGKPGQNGVQFNMMNNTPATFTKNVPAAVESLAHVHGEATAFTLPDGTIVTGAQYKGGSSATPAIKQQQPKN